MYLPHDLASPLTSCCSSWIVLLLFLTLSAFLAAVFACADLPSGDQTVSLPISKRSSKRSHPTSCGKIQPGGGQAGVLGGGKVAKKKATPLVKALANPSYSRQSPVKGAVTFGAAALGTSLDGKSKCTVMGPSRLRLVKGGKAGGRTSPKKGPPHTKTDRASPKKAPAGKKISPKPTCSKVAVLGALKSTYSQYSFARVEPRKTEILLADSSDEELPSVIPTPEDF